MSEYTREQIIEMATNVRDCAWPDDVKEYMVLIEPMLRAYAATLRQQGGMVGDALSDLSGDWRTVAAAHAEAGYSCCADVGRRCADELQAALAQNQHPDDVAVDRFAVALKAKLAEARAKGRGGWNGDEPGMQQRLSDMLRDHVAKGDPRDVGNFAMFLHQRGEHVLPAQTTQGEGKPAAWLHTVTQGDSETDLALSFSPDSFPLDTQLGFRSIGAVPLYTHAERATVPDDVFALARRCLWLAYAWNDHNFERADIEARKEAQKWGINSFDEANDWPAAAPSQPVEVDRTDALEDEQWCETHGMHHSVEMRDPDCEFPDSQPAEGE